MRIGPALDKLLYGLASKAETSSRGRGAVYRFEEVMDSSLTHLLELPPHSSYYLVIDYPLEVWKRREEREEEDFIFYWMMEDLLRIHQAPGQTVSGPRTEGKTRYRYGRLELISSPSEARLRTVADFGSVSSSLL